MTELHWKCPSHPCECGGREGRRWITWNVPLLQADLLCTSGCSASNSVHADRLEERQTQLRCLTAAWVSRTLTTAQNI